MSEEKMDVVLSGINVSRMIEDTELFLSNLKRLNSWIVDETRRDTESSKRLKAMFDPTVLSKDEEAVLGFIKKEGSVTRKNLTLRFMGRFKADDLNRITEKLREMDLLAFTERPGVTRPSLVYVYVGP